MLQPPAFATNAAQKSVQRRHSVIPIALAPLTVVSRVLQALRKITNSATARYDVPKKRALQIISVQRITTTRRSATNTWSQGFTREMAVPEHFQKANQLLMS